MNNDDNSNNLIMNDEVMTEELMKQSVASAFDAIRLDDSQKADLWKKIEERADFSQTERTAAKVSAKGTASSAARGSSGKSMFPRVLAMAAALLLVFGSIGWYTSRSNDIPSLTGHVYAAESRATDMTRDEVLVLTGDPASNSEFYVYAPAIYYLDSSRLVFGNGTGLVIYNIPESKVDGIIDMQAICSGYYNTDSVSTHVLVDGDKLIVFNTEVSGGDLTGEAGDDYENTSVNWKPWGYYHIFDLSTAGDGELLAYTESGNDEETITGFIEQGMAFEQEHLRDAFDNMSYIQSDEMDDIVGYGLGTYSEKAFVCRSENNEITFNVLVCRDNAKGIYEICSEAEKEGKEPVFTAIDLGITDTLISEVNELNRLPEYKYTGSDPALGVICDYLAGDYASEYYEGNGVCIPAPVVFQETEKDGELLVFGNFWCDNYCKNGNTLISVSGGEMPACFHLVKSGDTYEIASIDQAEDGEFGIMY